MSYIPDTEATNCSRCTRDNTFCWCSSIVLCLLEALFFVALGLILGAVFFMSILTALPEIIVAAVILAILIIVFLILRWCQCGGSR